MTAGQRALAWFALSFVALTGAGVAIALARAPLGAAELSAVAELPGPSLVALVLALAAIYATDALRYRVIGRAIGTSVSWRAAIDTSVANFFFSWLTPGSTFGVPATIYMLGRRGVPWDATVVIAFGKAFTGVAVLVVVAMAMVALGLGPRYDGRLLAVVGFGGAIFAALFAALTLAAFRPAPARAAVERGFGWLGARLGRPQLAARVGLVTADAVDRLARLRHGGLGPLVALSAAHLAYHGAVAAVGVIVLTAFGAEIDPRSGCAVVVYLAFTYLAPTPGGAGFAEALAAPFFGPLIGDARAVAFVFVFRGLTLWVQVLFAIPYMLIVGGVGEILARVARRRGEGDG